MLVEHIAIPHPSGDITIRLHERVTVFTGLDPAGRARVTDLLVRGLAGQGPATVAVRTDDGEAAHIGPGSALDDEPDAADVLRRLMVVGRRDLGLDTPPPEPALAGERTAASIAHHELIRELHALDAGATERSRLEAELGAAPTPPPPPPPTREVGGPDLDAVARCATLIDDLLRRRQRADDTLHDARAALRAAAGATWRPGDGAPPLANGLGSGLRAAGEALARAEQGGDAGQVHDARRSVARAHADLDAIVTAAEDEVRSCDRELRIIAAAADVEVGVTGPGAALTAALARRGPSWLRTDPADPAARLLARRRAALEARIGELPDEEEVRSVRHRLDEAVARLQSLGGPRGHDITRVRQALIGRAAALRPDGVAPIAPLVVDEALEGLAADHLCDLLDLVLRISERAQVVVLSGDPALAVWARHRAHVGDIRLVELGVRG